MTFNKLNLMHYICTTFISISLTLHAGNGTSKQRPDINVVIELLTAEDSKTPLVSCSHLFQGNQEGNTQDLTTKEIYSNDGVYGITLDPKNVVISYDKKSEWKIPYICKISQDGPLRTRSINLPLGRSRTDKLDTNMYVKISAIIASNNNH